jgi:hypothetical protein
MVTVDISMILLPVFLPMVAVDMNGSVTSISVNGNCRYMNGSVTTVSTNGNCRHEW